MITKVGIFGALVAGLYFVFNLFTGTSTPTTPESNTYQPKVEYFLPKAKGALIEHEHYTLSYLEEHEQAEWVAYQLKADELKQDWVEREDAFRVDPMIETGSATPDDYYRSGYHRGHLVPAADRMFSEEAMLETFLMSNISPQASNFNKGIWRELEELTRSWAKRCQELYVITGPVLSVSPKARIGNNQVSVPQAYYKVLLDFKEPEFKAIGFVIPNQVSFDPLYDFAVSVDEVEKLTGIDFFPDLMDDELEEELESSYNLDFWEFSKQKYELRNKKWNQE